MTTWITICDTCKRDDWQYGDITHTDGELLASKIEHELSKYPSIKVRRHSCLMGCSHSCNIVIQAEHKICYTLGNFVASEKDAKAILEYAKLYSHSEKGVVPYREWPTDIKGHFITRHPPIPKIP